MYLAALNVTLDLDPEVAQSDRERVLRALRDRVKHQHGSRVTVRTDDDSSIAVAFLDDNLERAKARLEDVAEHLDAAGQARILTTTRQVFAWFEGRFQETAESRLENEGDGHDDSFPARPGMGAMGGSRLPKTIVYADEDAEYESIPSQAPGGGGFAGRGLVRRGLRIPTRK